MIAFYFSYGPVTRLISMLTENSISLIIGSLRKSKKLIEAETPWYDFRKVYEYIGNLMISYEEED